MSEKVGSIHYDVTLETGTMVAGQRKVSQELDKTTGSLNQFSAKLTQVATAVAGYASALYLIKQSDAFTKMNAQLKLATESTRELAIAQADVRKIAQEAQADIGAVASLYAKVSTATKEMGIAQSKVSDITRSVSLALKVSGATALEMHSAILQLGQAFASGVLRGDEFNSIAEASPRLMKALADGIGVPIGALRNMAEQGKLTSEVLANALPKAIKDLEQEAKQVQSISGAFQELKNEVMLFVGEQATANGVVNVLTGGIGMLTNNLGLLAGVMATVAAVKFANWLQAIVAETYSTIAANTALASSNVAAAQSHAVATAATAALAAARVTELRAAVMSAEGTAALAIVTNGLVPAQARATVAADAHAASMLALSAAQKAASVTGGLVSGALGLLGGPIGIITTLLGLGATAWALWGSSASSSEAKAAGAVSASTGEIVDGLNKQIAKLKERNALASAGMGGIAKGDTEAAKKMGSLLTQINDLKSGKGIDGNAPLPEAARVDLLQKLMTQYGTLAGAVNGVAVEQDKLDNFGKQTKASEWLVKYATDAERLAAELKKAKAELGDAFTPEMERRITEKFSSKQKTGSGAKTKATPDQKFDDEKYLLGLNKKTVDGYALINAAEAEALRNNAKLLEDHKISRATYEKAITTIQETSAKDRRDLRLKEDAENEASIERSDKAMERAAQAASDAAKQKKDARDTSSMNTLQIKAGMGGEADKENLIRAQADAELARVEAAQQLDLTNSQTFADEKVAIEAKMVADIQALHDATNSLRMAQAADVFDSLVSITKNAAGEQSGIYHAMFAAQKAFAIASAIVNIQTAMSSAAMSVPFPGNLAAMGIVAANTASIISTISGTSMQGRQYGGPVNANSMYRVNETGAPEMFTAGNGSQYMMPNASGKVTAADKIGGNSAPTVIIQNMGTGQQVQSQSYDQQSNTLRMVMADLSNQFASNSGQVWSALRSGSNVTGRM